MLNYFRETLWQLPEKIHGTLSSPLFSHFFPALRHNVRVIRTYITLPSSALPLLANVGKHIFPPNFFSWTIHNVCLVNTRVKMNSCWAKVWNISCNFYIWLSIYELTVPWQIQEQAIRAAVPVGLGRQLFTIRLQWPQM